MTALGVTICYIEMPAADVALSESCAAITSLGHQRRAISLSRKKPQRELPGASVPQAQDLLPHRCGHVIELWVGGAAAFRQQNGCSKRRKGQVGGGKTLANQELFSLVELHINFSEDLVYALHRAFALSDVIRRTERMTGITIGMITGSKLASGHGTPRDIILRSTPLSGSSRA